MQCLLCFSSLHMNTYTQSSRIYTQTDENLVLLKAINHPDDLLSVPECSFYISSERTEQQGTHRMVYVQTSAPGAAQHVLPRNTENAENIHVTYAELNRAHTAAEKVQVCLGGGRTGLKGAVGGLAAVEVARCCCILSEEDYTNSI